MRYTKRAHLASLFDREKNEYLTIQEKCLLHNVSFYIVSIEINILIRIIFQRFCSYIWNEFSQSTLK